MSDRLNDLLPELRRPFTAAAVKIKPQVVTKDQKKGLVTFYIDSRLLVERLNTVVGAANWTDSYRLLAEGEFAVKFGLPIECSLTVDGVTKTDVGQLVPGEMDDKAWKSAYSDAFKRAGVKFGVGAFLYNLPQVWAETKVGQNGKAQGFSEAGVRAAKAAYAKWLTSPANIYGEALDHGDVEREDAEQAAPNNTSPVSQPGPPADSLSTVVARLKELDPVTQWASVLEDDAKKTYKEPGGLVALTTEQREHMAGRLKAHADKLEAAIAANGSAGESPQKGTDGSPDSGKPEESAEGAPAESLFQAPKGARGSKAAA